MTGALDHRIESLELTLTGADGAPLADREVVVEQTRHAFGFGNIGFDLIEHLGGRAEDPVLDAARFFGGADASLAETLLPAWLSVFNSVTLPFYWRGFEPEQGTADTDRMLRVARFFVEQGVTVKGHPLAWHTLAPEWLMALSDEEVAGILAARIRREVSDFAGVIDLWDAINETVILPVFTAEDNALTRLAQARGRMAVIRIAFDTARETNPNARLVLNDFDLTPAYEAVIEECLEAGIRIDALGLQTHMHQGYRGEDDIWQKMERFARFGLPLQLTETTLLSGELMPSHIGDLNDYVVDSWPSTPEGEARQADEIERHYRTVLAHPATESLTYWGLTDAGSWLGAPSGLLRADGSAKPAFEVLHRLITEEWWHEPRRLRTDARGVVRVRGFAGDYRVSVGDAVGAVVVPRGGGAARVGLDIAAEQHTA